MLLDTAGLLALVHRAESQHESAVKAYLGARVRLTHCYVLAELVPLATVRGIPRRTVLEFSKRLHISAEVEVVWVSETLHSQAIDLLLARPDKAYSLCDAVSFVLMRQRRILEALTADRHFEQEGFLRLLSNP